MKRLFLIFFLISLNGCYVFYHPGYEVPPGIFYENAILNRHVSTPSDLGSRIGMSCLKSYGGMVTSGDASIQSAAASKGIRTVKAVDYQRVSILAGAYTKLCTIVYGD